MNDRKTLRKQIRKRRRELTPKQQKKAAEGLLKQLIQQPEFIHAKHIALYLAADGEIDTQPIIRYCRSLKKNIYLPVLYPLRPNRLWFYQYPDHCRLQYNRFRIQEPSIRHNRKRSPWGLDLICLPLVGFDSQANRMGMGGGFYDRTLGYLRNRKGIKKPTLIGLAHECQRVDQLPIAEWDVPLKKIVTDTTHYP